MEIDWEEPRVKRTFTLSVLVPGLCSMGAHTGFLPWTWALLLAMPFGFAAGLVFGRRWVSRLCYCVPSVLTALTVVGVQWIVMHHRPSVMLVEFVLSEMLGLFFVMPVWAVFYRRLQTGDEPRTARLAAFRAAMRREEQE